MSRSNSFSFNWLLSRAFEWLSLPVTENRHFKVCFFFPRFFAVFRENVTPFVHTSIPIVFVYLSQAETRRSLLTMGTSIYTSTSRLPSLIQNFTGFTEIQPSTSASFAALYKACILDTAFVLHDEATHEKIFPGGRPSR